MIHRLWFNCEFFGCTTLELLKKRKKNSRIRASLIDSSAALYPLMLCICLSDALTVGLICHADLFPAHAPDKSQETGSESMEWSNDDESSSVSRPSLFDDQAGSASLMRTESPVDNSAQPFHTFDLPYAGPSSVSASTAWQLSALEAESSSTPLLTRSQAHLGGRYAVSPADDLPRTRSGTYPESMNSNGILCGSQTVSPTCTDYVGKRALLFVFSVMSFLRPLRFLHADAFVDPVGSRCQIRGNVCVALPCIRHLIECPNWERSRCNCGVQRRSIQDILYQRLPGTACFHLAHEGVHIAYAFLDITGTDTAPVGQWRTGKLSSI